jgi:hypothetical protein
MRILLPVAITTILIQAPSLVRAEETSLANKSAVQLSQIVRKALERIDASSLGSDDLDKRALDDLGKRALQQPALQPAKERDLIAGSSNLTDTPGLKWNLKEGRPSLEYRTSDNGVIKFRGSRSSVRIVATWRF